MNYSDILLVHFMEYQTTYQWKDLVDEITDLGFRKLSLTIM